MKRPSKYKSFIAWIALLVFLFVGFANFEGQVLCLEADGRVALENAIGGICSDSIQGVLHNQNVSFDTSKPQSLQDSHCKQCVDIPLSIDSIKQQAQPLEVFQGLLDMPIVVQILTNGSHYLLIATQSQMPQPPPVGESIHRYLSTIILLI